MSEKLAWLGLAVAVGVVSLGMCYNVRGETCALRPQGDTTERRAGYKWLYRIVDGRKCWYYSNLPLPRDELIWSYTEKEFNSDIDRVIERKFYRPIFDENNLLIDLEPQ